MAEIRLLIVDDHEIVRQGLRGFLELLPDFDIVGEGSTGTQAVTLTQELQPDVVLMDLVMPEMDGIEATRRIKLTHPDTHVLILSSFGEDDNVLPAIRAGALGYVLKDIPPEELAEVLRETAQGKSHLHPDIALKLVNYVREPGDGGDSAVGDLTEREIEILIHIGQGMSNREIAQELSISHATVKTHVSNLLSKLHLSDRTQAAIFAIRQGLVD